MTLFTEIIAKRLGIIKRPCYNESSDTKEDSAMQFLITIALCLALLFGVASKTESVPTMQTEPVSVQEVETETETEATAEAEVSLVPAYYRYDVTGFNADCERLAASRDADEGAVADVCLPVLDYLATLD